MSPESVVKLSGFTSMCEQSFCQRNAPHGVVITMSHLTRHHRQNLRQNQYRYQEVN